MGPAGNAHSGDDGRFTIAAIPNGTYRMHASIVMMNLAGRGAGGGGGVHDAGYFTSWSSGPVTGGVSVGVAGGVTGGIVGGMDQSAEVVVNGADVTGVRVVARRPPTPQ